MDIINYRIRKELKNITKSVCLSKNIYIAGRKGSPPVGNAYFGEVIYTDPESTEYYPINLYCKKVYLTDKKNFRHRHRLRNTLLQ
jgi:hypothetical protein